VSLPIVMIGAAILGLVVGWPSRRLIGDYLAIVTLFFGEAFVEVTNNVAAHALGGPNGIAGIDPINALGVQITTNQGYYYLLMSPALVQQNFRIIKEIHASGVSVLMVEQNAMMALSIADRGYVLSTGEIVLEGAASELLRSEDLKRAYLGR